MAKKYNYVSKVVIAHAIPHFAEIMRLAEIMRHTKKRQYSRPTETKNASKSSNCPPQSSKSRNERKEARPMSQHGWNPTSEHGTSKPRAAESKTMKGSSEPRSNIIKFSPSGGRGTSPDSPFWRPPSQRETKRSERHPNQNERDKAKAS